MKDNSQEERSKLKTFSLTSQKVLGVNTIFVFRVLLINLTIPQQIISAPKEFKIPEVKYKHLISITKDTRTTPPCSKLNSFFQHKACKETTA